MPNALERYRNMTKMLWTLFDRLLFVSNPVPSKQVIVSNSANAINLSPRKASLVFDLKEKRLLVLLYEVQEREIASSKDQGEKCIYQWNVKYKKKGLMRFGYIPTKTEVDGKTVFIYTKRKTSNDATVYEYNALVNIVNAECHRNPKLLNGFSLEQQSHIRGLLANVGIVFPFDYSSLVRCGGEMFSPVKGTPYIGYRSIEPRTIVKK